MKKYKNVEKNARVKMFLTACPSPPLFLSLIKSQGYSSKLKFITREIAVFRCHKRSRGSSGGGLINRTFL